MRESQSSEPESFDIRSTMSKAFVDERTRLTIIERSWKPVQFSYNLAACSRSSGQYARSYGEFGRNASGHDASAGKTYTGQGAKSGGANEGYQITAKSSIILNPYVICQTPDWYPAAIPQLS